MTMTQNVAPSESRSRRETPAGIRPGTSANEAWEALLTAHAVLMRQFAAAGIWREVSMREYDVLYTLAKCSAPVRQSELEAYVLLSQPAISRLVDRLAARGLVSKAVDPGDRRGVLLALTDDGRAVQRRVGARHARDVARLVGSRLDQEQLADLQRLARLLAAPPTHF